MKGYSELNEVRSWVNMHKGRKSCGKISIEEKEKVPVSKNASYFLILYFFFTVNMIIYCN